MNFKPKLFKANVECNGTNGTKQKGHSFSKCKFSLNGGDLMSWFTFNLAVHFRPKMALMLAILAD